MKLKGIILCFTLLTVAAAFTGLFLYYDSQKTAALKRDLVLSGSRIIAIDHSISHLISNYHRITFLLSRQEELFQALADPSASNLKNANEILDIYNYSLQTDVCYLLNRDGVTTASSNRRAKDSFVGKNYAFRPYFRRSHGGAPFVYMALGVTSGKRGVYFSSPVYNPGDGAVLGVVVIKEKVDKIENDILTMDYPVDEDQNDIIAITNPDGVVFISNREDLLFQPLWKLDDKQIEQLALSRQFGKGPWNWGGFRRIGSDKVIDRDGAHYHFLTNNIQEIPNWKIIYLSNADVILDRVNESIFRTAGYLFFVVFIIIAFVLVVLMYFANKAEKTLRISEERYRTVTETVNEGIVLQAASGEILTWNRGAAKILGIASKDAIGRKSETINWHAIHEDGTRARGSSHPFIRSLERGEPIKNEIMGVFRPSGELRWISINSTPLRWKASAKPYAAAISFADITELKKEKDQSQRYLDVAGVMLLAFNASGVITLVNKKGCEILEGAENELLGKNWFDHFTPVDQVEDAKEAFQKILAGEIESAPYTESLIQTMSAKEREIAWNNVLLRTDDGRNLGMLCSGEDITDRKLTEEALRESQALLQAAMDHSHAGIAIADAPDGQLRYVNKSALNILGESRERRADKVGLAQNVESWPIFHFDGRPYRNDEVPLIRAVRYGEICSREYIVKRSDAADRIVWANAAPIYNEKGVITAGIVIFLDITQRKRTEEALEKQIIALTRGLDDVDSITFEALFKLDDIQRLQDEFALAAGVASIITQPDGTPITRPSNFCRLCNDIIRKTERGRQNCFKSDAALGRHNPDGPIIQPCLSGGLWDAGAAISIGGKHIANWLIGQVRDETQSEEKMRAYAREIGASEETVVEAFREVPSMSRDQFARVARALFTLAKQLSNSAYQNIQQARFISELKQSEKEQQRLQSQLIQSQKMESVGRLAGGVAHDFNNMLSIILGNTEIVMEDMAPDDPLQGNMHEIRKAAKRSAEFTRQLLAFARKQPIAPKVLELNQTLEGMLKMLRRLIGENIELVWRPANGLWPVKVDSSQIDQMVANLCVNARDSIKDNGRIIIETANVNFDETYCQDHEDFVPGDFILIAVSDNGRGMDPKTRENLFEPFYTTKEVGEGTGLGLATVYGNVKQNSGFIKVLSEPDQGARFEIYLPRHTELEARVKDQKQDSPVLKGSETILLVEDEKPILRMATMILERLGYRVLSAASPVDAIHTGESYQSEICLLITDVVMPGMSGRDLANHLLGIHPQLKCLFMSGYTADVIAHHGVMDEGIHFINKPFSKQELAAKVREVLSVG